MLDSGPGSAPISVGLTCGGWGDRTAYSQHGYGLPNPICI